MRCYTIPEAAEATGLTAREIRTRVDGGRLRAIHREGQRVIPEPELERTGLLGGPEGRAAAPRTVNGALHRDRESGSGITADAALGQLRADLERQSNALRGLERLAIRAAAAVEEERARFGRERDRLAAELGEARSQSRWASDRLHALEGELSGRDAPRSRAPALTALHSLESS